MLTNSQVTNIRSPARYINRLRALETERSSWSPHWRDLADHILPRRARFDTSDRWKGGSKRNDKIVNNTATRGLRILASGMMAGITSPARPWFRLRTGSTELNKRHDVRAWLEQVERVILEVYARSNVYNALALVYLDIGCYGTTSMFVEDHAEDALRAHVMPIGSYYLAQNDAYQINTVYRETTLTVEQLVRRFGDAAVSRSTKDLYDKGQYDVAIEVLHCIEPNDRIMHGNFDRTGMAFKSAWIEWGGQDATTGTGGTHGGNEHRMLGLGGFEDFPVMAPRWMVTGEDVYGSSPGMDALGDIRALQHMEKRRAKALDKIVDPPMTGPSTLRSQRTSLLPGDVTYVDSQGGRSKFEPAHVIDPRIVMLDTELGRHETRINASFYADLFLMLATSGLRQPITAREVQERHEEKMLQLGPALERLQDELLDPLIDRTVGILLRRGLLPDIPGELQGQEIRPEYISILAQSQKLISTVAIERLVQFSMGMAEARPEVLDKIDWDRTIDEYGEMLGVNPELIVPESEVAALREQREKQQALANPNNAKTLQAGASAAESLANTDVSDDSALNRLLAAYGGDASIGQTEVPSA